MQKSTISKFLLYFSIIYLPLIGYGIFSLISDSETPAEIIEVSETSINQPTKQNKKLNLNKQDLEKAKKEEENNSELIAKTAIKEPISNSINKKQATKEKAKPQNKKIAKKKKRTKKEISSQEHARRYTNKRPYLAAKSSATQQSNMTSWREKNILSLLNQTQQVDDTTNDENESSTNSAEKIPFQASFQNHNGKKLSGGMITKKPPIDLKEAKRGKFEFLPSDLEVIATTNIQGSTSFKLEKSENPTDLFFIYNKEVFKVFSNTISEDHAWSHSKIELDIEKSLEGEVYGHVRNLGQQPVKGAIISNIEIESLEEHKQLLKNEAYKFIITNEKGQYSLSGLELDLEIQLFCYYEKYPVITSKKIKCTDSKRISHYNFKIEQPLQEPAVWAGKIIDQNERPAKNIKIGIYNYKTLSEAVAANQYFTTDENGNFATLITEYEKESKLYHYDEQNGITVISQHLFEMSEKYTNTYQVEIFNDFKGSISFRLQDKDGRDIKLGWIGTDALSDETSLTELINNGGYGSILAAKGETLIQNIPSYEEIEFFYSNILGEKISLGSFQVKENETLQKIIRLDGNANLPAAITGKVIDGESNEALDGIIIKAMDSNGKEILSAISNEEGTFDLNPLTKYFRYTIILFDEGSGLEQKQENTVLLEADSKDLGTIKFKRSDTFSFSVLKNITKDQNNSSGDPIQNAQVTLLMDGITIDSQKSDIDGKVKFLSLKLDQNYTAKITHPEYEESIIENFSPLDNHIFNLTPKKIIIVRLTGYDWKQPMFIKSFIAIDNGDLIVPDKSAGNEYAEILNNDTIYFLTPPVKPFYIYVGAMPNPWGAKLYGPFQTNTDDNIEVELALEQTSPSSIELTGAQLPGMWNLSIFAIPETQKTEEEKEFTTNIDEEIEEENLNDIKAYQILSTHNHSKKSPSYYLAPGKYKFLLSDNQGDFYDKVEIVDIKNGEKLSYSMQAKDIDIPIGGYVNSYIVSDRFDLGTSIENSHHQQKCPGFETDHLGGEENFKAEHLGVYSAPNGSHNITWTKVHSNTDGKLDFKEKFPDKLGDYSVAYAQFTVFSASERIVWLGVSSDDGIKAWHNGKRILYRHLATPLGSKDQKLVGNEAEGDPLLKLKAGENLFIFKVDNSWGQWALRTRFIDPTSFQPITDLRFLNGDGTSTVAAQ